MRIRMGWVFVGLAWGISATLTSAAGIEYVGSDKETGSSKAVIVEGLPLAHTTQLLPLDAKGEILGKGDSAAQAKQLLHNLAAVLEQAESSLDRVVKLHIYAVSPEAVLIMKQALAKAFAGEARPAVSFVAGKLPHPDALLALDAVAATKPGIRVQVQRLQCPKVYPLPGDSHVAILPTGSRIYVAGQAEKGETLVEATRKTMQSLEATLQFLKSNPASVVQIKAFLTPMMGAEQVGKEIRKSFPDQSCPPITFVEWNSTLPIEIELVAYQARAHRPADPVEYLTPPGMTSSPIFSRVAVAHAPKTVYVAGLYGQTANNGEAEVKEIFADLKTLLEKSGSDLRHLVKATYYVSTDDSSKKLNELRPNYYDPKRPPSASKALVPGVGVKDRSITLDMIAVPAK